MVHGPVKICGYRGADCGGHHYEQHAARGRAGAVSGRHGVAALQVAPVHYVFRPDDDAMVRHFAGIATASGAQVIMYNVRPRSSPLLLRILECYRREAERK